MEGDASALDRFARIANDTDLRDLIRQLLDKFPLSPKTVPLLSYRNVVAYTVDHAPPTLRADQCIVVRKPHPRGFLIVQAFTNAEGQLVRGRKGEVLGRRIVAKELDPELTELFGEKDLLVLR